MSEIKKNIEFTNGWILCPSKSFPGKFYYFNVLNGEAAWSLNQSDNKGSIKESGIHKITDQSHGYPEPTTVPHNIFNTRTPDFLQNIPSNHQLSKFGQATFYKYVTNVEPSLPSVIRTSVPLRMFCPEPEKPMFDQKFEHLKISQSTKQTNIPLSERFKNYKKPCNSFDRDDKILKPVAKFETSTPKNLFLECISESQNFFPKTSNTEPTSQPTEQKNLPLCNRFKNWKKPCFSFDRNKKILKPLAKFETSTPKNLFLECVSESQSLFPKTLIKEPTLKLESKLPIPKIPDIIKTNEKRIITFSSSKVESTKSPTEVPKFTKNEEVYKNLDSSDLRLFLLSKRRSKDVADTAVERKKAKPTELKCLTIKKKVTFNLKDQTDDDTATDDTQQDFTPLIQNHTRTIIEAPKSPVFVKDKTPPYFMIESSKKPSVNVEEKLPALQPTPKYQRPTFNDTTWYIVVDTDVLLLDYELIDKLVLSNPKSRLIIPHAVAADIEALCLGNCNGQQRVINARQLTRKLATPPPHYIVEPRTLASGNIVLTTESILQCCMKVLSKNYYVVLITNDPHLQIRATLLDIQSYKLNEIKYGVDIKPNITPDKKNIKIITPNNVVTDTKNHFNQSLFSNIDITNPEVTSDEKNVTLTSRNDVDGTNHYNNNFSYMRPVKKLSLSTDSETDYSVRCNKLINVTQPKCLKNIANIDKSDTVGVSDISSEVSSLNLKDKNVLKPQNVDRNPFLRQNVKENGVANFKKRKLNSNTVFNSYSIRRTIPKEKPVSKPNHQINDFKKDTLDYNIENKKNPFCSTPITNIKVNESKKKFKKSVNLVMSTTCLTLRQKPFGMTRENKVLNPSQTRVEKLIRSINSDSTTNNQIRKTKDSTGLFKIPKLLAIKNATQNTTVPVENSTANDQIVTRTKIDSIDENLKRFPIKSRNTMNKIKTRIDEWICSYMQIMEDALMHILQNNCVCMENTVAPLTLKDTLNCIKMLFGSHTNIRDLIDKLSELLEKCMLCTQGKLKMSILPDDFMKIFGYGVMLIEALKNIHPEIEELKEAELRLQDLQTNLESNTKELDPELVESPSLNQSKLDNGLEEIRPHIVKNKSFVLDYLKKHFKVWENYKEDLDDQNHNMEEHTDFKVVRTRGKNLNLLKLDNKKKMTLSKITVKEDLAHKSENGPKFIRLLENNQTIKPGNNENVGLDTKNDTKLMRLSNYESNQNVVATDQEQVVPLKKIIDSIENNESKVSEEFNYTTHENTFQDNTEKTGPKIIRNIKLIDDFENKFNNLREPLDLDLFYSEIYEPSIDGNIIDFDVLSEKNENAEEINENNHFEDNNYGLNNATWTLEDFYITPSNGSNSKNNNYTFDTEHSSNKVKETQNSEHITSRYFNSVSENNDKNAHNEEETEKKNCDDISQTFTENHESHNESRIGNGNSETNMGNSKTPNNDSGTHLDNSETYNDNFGKTAQIVRDDSTNDSGFENDSTYAHTLIKIFLNELSTTFKVIHTFVSEFIVEIRETELSVKRKDALHNQASKALEDMVAIIQHLRSIIKRESVENTALKMLLLNAGVEATSDKRMTRYRQIVIKCLEQALILESALKVIVSTTMGDFDALSTNAETLNLSIQYFNIFE